MGYNSPASGATTTLLTGTGTPLAGYSTVAASAAGRYRLDESDTLTGTLRAWGLDGTQDSSRFRSTSLQGGWERMSSERIHVKLQAGAARVRSEPAGAATSDSTRALASFDASWNFGTGTAMALAARDIYPTGLGSLTSSDRVSTKWGQKLTDRWEFTVQLAGYRNHFFGGLVDQVDSRYVQADASLSWQATEEIVLEAGASHANVAYSGIGISAGGSTVYLSAKLHPEGRPGAHN